jgi:hypothetical protein
MSTLGLQELIVTKFSQNILFINVGIIVKRN